MAAPPGPYPFLLLPLDLEHEPFVHFVLGQGGVITPGLKSSPPWVWKHAWPQDIQNELVSYTNPKDRLMINDIELAGLVLGWMVL